MADLSKPVVTDTYANFATEIVAAFSDLSMQLRTAHSTPTNPPQFAVRFNDGTGIWEQNTGTPAVPVWSALAATYGISISGNAATASTAAICSGNAASATYASAVSSNGAVATNAVFYVPFIGGGNTNGNYILNTTAGFYFNPSTGVLVCGTYNGAGTGLSGTAASLNIGGNAATATTAGACSGNSATATTATTANGLNTANNYQVNSLGVGTAASGTAGEIRATNNITAYYSDQRLKDILGGIDDAVRRVMRLRAVYYKGNALAGSFGYDVDEMQVGVIAQDVQTVMPMVVKPAPFDRVCREGKDVSRTGEEYLTVQYERLVPLLVAAIQEQQKQIDDLRARLK